MKKKGSLFQPETTFKLSRSKIELFCECPRCFYLDQKLGVKRPGGPPFTLNNAIDALWKGEFDLCRAEQKPHPILTNWGINVIPFQHEQIDNWRNNRRGVQYLHEPTQFLLFGAPDEIAINSEGKLVVIDVKATSKESEINLDADWQMSYKRQMEIYQWLLRQNGFSVAKRGYFVYCNGMRNESSCGTRLEFDVSVIPYDGNDTWIEPKLQEIRECLLSDQIPVSSADCSFCKYGNSLAEALSSQ